MELGATISYLYPNLENGRDYILMDKGEGPVIVSWNAGVPQPTELELQTAWEEYQTSPKPVEIPMEERIKSLEEAMNFILLGGI